MAEEMKRAGVFLRSSRMARTDWTLTITTFHRWSLALLLILAAPACAPGASGVYGQQRSILAVTDDFGMLLLNAGIRAEALLVDGELAVDEAKRLRMVLGLELADGGMQRYGPRVAANYLLSEVITDGEAVPRFVLNERLRRFEQLAVLRPDGYLVMTLTGSQLQCIGPLQVQEGNLSAGDFKLGAFYTSTDGGFREDTSLPLLPNSAYFNGVVVTVETK